MRKSIDRMELVHDFLKCKCSGSLHAKRNLFAGQWNAGGSDGGVVGRFGDRACAGASARSDGQTRDQTGRSPPQQRRARRMEPVRAMGARGRGPAQGDRRGDGLDRFRRRQSGHARLEPDHAPRPGDAAPMADGRQGRTEDAAQRLRRPCWMCLKAILPEGVAVTILADRGFGDVKLFEFLESLGFGYVIRFRGNVHVTAADGETRLKLADGSARRARPPSARRRTHRRAPQGRRGGLRPRQGDEGGLGSGRQRCDRERLPDRQPLRRNGGRSSRGSATPRICVSVWA